MRVISGAEPALPEERGFEVLSMSRHVGRGCLPAPIARERMEPIGGVREVDFGRCV